MMPLDRLAALVATVGPDRTSALADAAAARWSLPPGAARYVRTSATAVFVTPAGYLRLVPTAAEPPIITTPARPAVPRPPIATAQPAVWGEQLAVATVARVTAELAAAGAPVAAPLPAAGGGLVASAGTVLATLVAAAPGTARELTDLGEDDGVRWGEALAQLHAAGRAVDRSGLRAWPEIVVDAVRAVADAELADTVEALVGRCLATFGPPTTLVHGDPQPDNARWVAGGPVFFDLDDACLSWPIADLAMAVRDVQPIDVLDTPVTSSPLGRALVRGYRRAATLTDIDDRAVIALQRLAAAQTYVRLRAATGVPVSPEPDWLTALRTRLEAVAARLRAALLPQP